MSYYQGDFYGRGGYYRGDPGFFSFIGGLAKGAVGMIPGVGPALASGLGALTKPKMASAIVKAGEGTLATRAMKGVTSIVKGHPVLSAAGAAGALGLGLGAGAEALMGGAKRGRRGFHMNKHGKMVRNRYMNPCNPRALRRAIRRAHGFERLAKHVLGFSSPRKPKGHMYFKRKRKR